MVAVMTSRVSVERALMARRISLILDQAFSMGFRSRRIGRQIEQFGSRGFDQLGHSTDFVGTAVIHDLQTAARDRSPHRPRNISQPWPLRRSWGHHAGDTCQLAPRGRLTRSGHTSRRNQSCPRVSARTPYPSGGRKERHVSDRHRARR
jgi:hypothetical protein